MWAGLIHPVEHLNIAKAEQEGTQLADYIWASAAALPESCSIPLQILHLPSLYSHEPIS